MAFHVGMLGLSNDHDGLAAIAGLILAKGMNKITGDLTKMAAQVPALFETLSGMSISELLSKVRVIGDKSPKPDVLPPADPNAKSAGAGK